MSTCGTVELQLHPFLSKMLDGVNDNFAVPFALSVRKESQVIIEVGG
jgi:hypothetical protein